MVYPSTSLTATQETTEPEQSATAAREWRLPVAAFVLGLLGVWVVFYVTDVMLPFIRPGSQIIWSAKFETLVKEPMFGEQDRYRLMVFGHSKALTSVRPRELDAALGHGFRTYNLGLPGDERFLPILEAALSAGNIPTHVLLMLPWDAKPNEDGALDLLRNDAAIANAVVPFRTFPRDATLFVALNRKRLANAIQEVDLERRAMLQERGWYFIKSQSHYADDRLPDDYALPTDYPTRVEQRKIAEKSFTRERLEQLARRYGFQVLMIPVPFRIGQYAPAPASDQGRLATISAQPLMRIVGPDYFSYPPARFADASHMNLNGALAYTADLAKLLKASGVFD
jgi:hypothetical protein